MKEIEGGKGYHLLVGNPVPWLVCFPDRHRGEEGKISFVIALVDRSTEPKRLVAIERQKRAKWLIKRDSVIINNSEQYVSLRRRPNYQVKKARWWADQSFQFVQS